LYERTPSQIAKSIEILLNHLSLTLQDSEVVAAALEKYNSRPSIGFSDCMVLEIARKAGHSPLGTFDKNLAKLGETQRL
ncbi:MAG: hypothetical protein ACK5YU_08845, partial [Burkholderiales bacterium]